MAGQLEHIFRFQAGVAFAFSNRMPSVWFATPRSRENPANYLDFTSEFRSETPLVCSILVQTYLDSNLLLHSTFRRHDILKLP